MPLPTMNPAHHVARVSGTRFLLSPSTAGRRSYAQHAPPQVVQRWPMAKATETRPVSSVPNRFLFRGSGPPPSKRDTSVGGIVLQRASEPPEDPAHMHWHSRGQGPWNLMRFFREGGYGMRGYTLSYFEAPPLEAPPEVARDPVRLAWHNQLARLRNTGRAPAFLMEQWMWQNISQAEGGNPLPVEAGRRMIAGAEEMGRATTIFDLLRGHYRAQINSLGGSGFRGGASMVMHGLSLPVQWPNLILHGLVRGPQSLTQDPVHPMRDLVRWGTSLARHPGARGSVGVISVGVIVVGAFGYGMYRSPRGLSDAISPQGSEPTSDKND